MFIEKAASDNEVAFFMVFGGLFSVISNGNVIFCYREIDIRLMKNGCPY